MIRSDHALNGLCLPHFPRRRAYARLENALIEPVGVEETAGAEALEHFLEAGIGESETAFAASETAHRGEHAGLRIPGGMDDDRAGSALLLLDRARARASRGRNGQDNNRRSHKRRSSSFRARLVGEALQEAGMLGIRAAAMRDEVTGNAAAIGVEQIEARIGRRLGEIGDADHIDMLKRGAVAIEAARARATMRGSRTASTATRGGRKADRGCLPDGSPERQERRDMTVSAPAAAPASIIAGVTTSVIPSRSEWER